MRYLSVAQIAKSEGVTEQLKSDGWLCRLQKMNSTRSRAEEVVSPAMGRLRGTKFPHCIKNANGVIRKKSKSGIDRTEEMAYSKQ